MTADSRATVRPDRPGANSTALSIGVDVGGTKILGVVLAGRDNVVAEVRLATPVPRDSSPKGNEKETYAASIAAAVGDVITSLCSELDSGDSGRLLPLCVGLPGMVDRGGVLCFSPHLPVDPAFHVTRAIGEVLDEIPHQSITFANDANCAAYAEVCLGAAHGADLVTVVTLGTGIGGAVVVNGTVQIGAHGFAGEFGHMVVDPGGIPCQCGRRGCWEQYASGDGLGRMAREAVTLGRAPVIRAMATGTAQMIRAEHVAEAAKNEDPGALEIIEEFGRWVALGLTNLATMWDPDRFVLGGGVAEIGDPLFATVRRAYDRDVEGARCRPEVPIVAARFGERAGAIGAALVAANGGLP